MEDLLALAKLINDSVNQIVLSCEANTPFPALDEPFTPASEAFRAHESVSKAANTITAAAGQLIALVRPPPLTLGTTALSFHLSSATRVVLETNVAEILREAGPKGLHVQQIAEKNKQDPNKLSRILRLLATEHIFREVSPDVFANNRISSVLDTGKSSADLLARPSEKHEGTNGVAAVLSHSTNQMFKSSSYLTDTFLDPEFSLSNEPTKTAFSKAFGTDLVWFNWLEQPGNEAVRAEFGMAMEGAQNMQSPGQILEGLDWKALPQGSVVVDVGGGVGSQSLLLVKAHPHLKIILQDLESTLQDAKTFWKERFPEALASGQVTLQTIDFFASQPVKNASIYLMRFILHDWADSYCIKILTKLRESATPETQLLILDNFVEYACKDTTAVTNIPGGVIDSLPAPLLPNYGHASTLKYMSDLQMMVSVNGQERTIAHMGQLLQSSGWKISRIFRTPSLATQVLAVTA